MSITNMHTQNVVVHFPSGNHHHHHLDPSAQEFRPIGPGPTTFQAHHFLPPHPSLYTSPAAYVIPPPQPQPPAILPPSLPPPPAAPTRAVLLSAVPTTASESLLRRDLEPFGDVRAVQMERLREGLVTVHFYDVRAAHAALDSVRLQHMHHQSRLRLHFINNPTGPPPSPPPSPGLVSGRPVWAQFSIPATNAFPDGLNQGTIVVFNLDPTVSAPALREIFQQFGEVKELRETPMKKQQRFVEFYDVRDASRALTEMNGKEINGRAVMIEFSRPGGICHKKLLQQQQQQQQQQQNASYHHGYHIQAPTTPPPPPPPRPPYTTRRHRRVVSGSSRRRQSPSSEEGSSVEAAMGGMSLKGGGGGGGGGGGDHDHSKVIMMISSNNNNNNGSKVNCSLSKSSKGGRPLRGKQKNYDPRFMIKEEAIVTSSDSCKDMRTTVMIKNIPNKYSQKLLLNMLDNHCIHCNEQISGTGGDQPLSSYDFVYLPIDFNNKCNVGYGFVNMTSPEATLRLYKAFHHQHWEVFNSRKICEVTYARVQGLEALKEHFKNSKFACENDDYLPVVFTPPRDGRQLTTPLPIVLTPSPTVDEIDGGDITSTSTTTNVPSSSDSHHDDHDHDGSVGGSYSSNGIEEPTIIINDGDDDVDEGCSHSSST